MSLSLARLVLLPPALVAGSILAFLLSSSHATTAEVLSGYPRVTDGDTLRFATDRVRLHGIDAPESGQTCRRPSGTWSCGARATHALRDRIVGAAVVCEIRDRDRYGRAVSVCRIGALDLNEWMVSNGWAIAYVRYSSDYVVAHRSARAASIGIWQGAFVEPSSWRRGERLRSVSSSRVARAPRAAASSKCSIKGNISRGGQRIYHVPGSRSYAATRINTGAGERWFCSESAARAAGWRAPRR